MGNLLSESSLETHYTEEGLLAQLDAFEVIESKSLVLEKSR